MSINNGNGFSGNGDRHPNNGIGHYFADLREQEEASLNKRIEPASPEEFLKWARQDLRDKRTLYNDLSKEHKELVKAGDLATVGLTRLSSLVKQNERITYENLLELHRIFMFRNQNIGYTLGSCKEVLDETTLNIQFVGETLVTPLADRHKKIAVQKELGLRLRDTDADFDRCKRAIDEQRTTYRQLSEGIQKLMNDASIKLPPKIREKMNLEDRVAEIALMHRGSLQKGRDAINSNPYTPKKDVAKVNVPGSLGEESSVATVEASKVDSKAEPTMDIKYALASTTIGLIIGILIFFVALQK